MRRAGQLLADDAMQFLQLLHQVVLRVQSSRRVNEQVIRRARLRGGHGVVRDGRRVRAVSAGDDFDLQARAPQFQLLDRRRAKRVARGEQRGFFLRLDEMRELRARRRLARAVHADDGNNRRAARRFHQSVFICRKTFFNFAARNRQKIQTRAALRFVIFFDGGNDLLRHRHAQIGGDERGFKFFNRVRRQFRRARDDAFDFVRELGVRFREAGFEFVKKSHEILATDGHGWTQIKHERKLRQQLGADEFFNTWD